MLRQDDHTGPSPFVVGMQVVERFEPEVSADRLTRVAGEALKAGRAEPGARVDVTVADDDLVTELNRRYRGLDETTDVLSFSPAHEGAYYGENPPPETNVAVPFVLPPGEVPSLGDVVISYTQARRQAVAAGHSVERELAALLVHGLLHLLGHDHEQPEEEAEMRALEARILAGLARRDERVTE